MAQGSNGQIYIMLGQIQAICQLLTISHEQNCEDISQDGPFIFNRRFYDYNHNKINKIIIVDNFK